MLLVCGLDFFSPLGSLSHQNELIVSKDITDGRYTVSGQAFFVEDQVFVNFQLAILPVIHEILFPISSLLHSGNVDFSLLNALGTSTILALDVFGPQPVGRVLDLLTEERRDTVGELLLRIGGERQDQLFVR